MQSPGVVPQPVVRTSLPVAFLACAAVGVLGGMIGLGGAEFRLPLLIALFGFAALQAVIVNKALSLIVVAIAAALVGTHAGTVDQIPLTSAAVVVAGVLAGFGIGVVAAIMGVAGGELLIPTIVLLFGVGIKVAGSLSLAVSLPTMIVAFARYSRDGSFAVLRRHARLVAVMALGSVVGAVAGGLLLGVVPDVVLVPLLAVLLVLSSVKVWRHAHA